MPDPKLLRIEGCRPASLPTIAFGFEGARITATAGESIAAALAASGIHATRTTRRLGEPRAYFCGMGVCWECVVEVLGIGQVRGCMTPVADGLEIRRVGAGDPP